MLRSPSRSTTTSAARAYEAQLTSGIDVRLEAKATAVRGEDGRRTLTLDGGDEVSGEKLLVAIGRAPRVEGIGLETVGIESNGPGIQIDERCRAADGVCAIGDVTGVMPFTHVGKYQARICCADIAGEDVRADYRAIPRVVFSDPEIAAVGLTEQQARDQGIEVATARLDLTESIARPYTYETNPHDPHRPYVNKGVELSATTDPDGNAITLIGNFRVECYMPAAGTLVNGGIRRSARSIRGRLRVEESEGC